jgi:hypothetical protein
MKERKEFFGKLLSKTHKSEVKIAVDILEYDEDGLFFIYSPALDLIGYGESPEEAKHSWETVLCEYIQYGLNKKTLFKDLENRGWKIKNKNEIHPPTFSWMLQNYQELNDVYDKHDFKKTKKPVTMPLAYA